eukprot:Em0022g691a
MFVLGFLLPFLLGVFVTISIAVVLLLYWFYRQPLSKCNAARFPQYVKPSRNELLNDMLEGLPQHETCIWLNLVIDFLFHELRDSQEVRSLVMKFMKKEFEEFMTTKTEGRMLEQLTVRDYFLGTSLPLINSATVKRVDKGNGQSEEVDIALDVDYSGDFHIEIDADLVLSKVAFISVTVQRVRGTGQLQFSRNPFTHWSFTFYEDPELLLEVTSCVEGRKIPQLSSIIEKQIRKWVKRKHTMPGKKIRYKPFFKPQKLQNELLDVFVHNQKITVGSLQVQVVECTRLPVVENASEVFCTVNVAPAPFKPTLCLWQTKWPVKEFVINRKENVAVGFEVCQISSNEKVTDLVVVSRVSPGSVASIAGLRKGDIVMRINNMRVPSFKNVTRLLHKTKELRILITVERPPTHVVDRLLGKTSVAAELSNEGALAEPPGTGKLPRKQRLATHIEGDTNSGGVDNGSLSQDAGTDFVRHIPAEDTVSLCGVGGEVDVLNEIRQRRPIPRSPHAGSGAVHSALPETVTSIPNELLPDAPPTSEPVAPGIFPQLPVSEDGMDDDSEGDYHATAKVEANRNPSWNHGIMFALEDHHHYLNVAVWLTLKEGKGKLLLGHVTISLTDIAVYCLSTSAGIHQQCYCLVPAQLTKVTVSRTVLDANSSSNKGSKPSEVQFGGDIILRFQHTPQCKEDVVKSKEKEKQEEEEEVEPNEEDRQKFARHHPPSSATKDHRFQDVEGDTLKDVTCSICSKKIRWRRILVCSKCHLQCDKKCAEYCMKVVPCYRQVLDEYAETENSEAKPAAVENEPVPKSTPPLLRAQLQNVAREKEDDGYDEEDEQRLLEFGASLYSHQPLEERIPALEKKIAELETEIARVTDLIKSESEQLTSSGSVQRKEERIAHHEEKLKPLRLMLRQNKFALCQSQAEREH